MALQLDQLRAFLAVLEQGTFDAAARQLRVTPSAISQRIKALETSVGGVLLTRSKPATVTEAGAIVQRLARQVALLEADALTELSETVEGSGVRIPIVVNADSLATWMMPALAIMVAEHGVLLEVFREDEAHSIQSLRDGTAIAAVTSSAETVQGCISRELGRMRYRPMASPAFRDRWFPDGPTTTALAHAPVVVFDRKDDLQDQYLRTRSRTLLSPPRHWIPGSNEFVHAVRLGFGWGMLPTLQTRELEASGQLVALDPDFAIDVPLRWQAWNLSSPTLLALTASVEQAAAAHLD